ncbi:MAG: hypothetical protein EAX87_14435 [Candidatus Thorarchaeota archaeon]|nr:hypothetical protein [Candidatus Thorarchaeota archaeon]
MSLLLYQAELRAPVKEQSNCKCFEILKLRMVVILLIIEALSCDELEQSDYQEVAGWPDLR